MPKTKIEWVRNPDGTQGHSWNPLRGVKGKWHCTKVSPGCANCYAERMNLRFSGIPYTVGADTIRLDEKILVEPLSWRKPRMVFVCSMTDLFHEDVDFTTIAKIWRVMYSREQHTFQVLTKRPERAAAFFESMEFLKAFGAGWCGGEPFQPGHNLPNVWLGVSCENQEMFDLRWPILAQIPAAIRWLSLEPLLGPINARRSFAHSIRCEKLPGPGMNGGEPCRCVIPDWIVVGGESGPGARPFDPEWGRDLLRQCRSAGVPFFGKQWDKKRPLPDDLMVREMPHTAIEGEGRG